MNESQVCPDCGAKTDATNCGNCGWRLRKLEVQRQGKNKKYKKMKALIKKVLGIFEEKHIFATPEDVEILYIYKDGVYVPGETTIKGEIEALLDVDASIGLCREVVEHLKRRSYVPRSEFNKFEKEIPVLNGLLNLETMQIRDFDPKKIFTYKINTKFDPSKDCPEFKKFLKQVLPKSKSRAVLQEYSGYTLLPAFPHHKFMILVGTGRNGKGVFIRTMEGILGKENITYIRLEYLDGSHRFMVANLFGTLMNVCSEPSTEKPFKTELLKQITGQDTLDGEIKFKQKLLTFMSFAKFFIQANKLPKVADKTPSFWERLLLVEFTERFTDEIGNRIPDIEKIWLEDEDERSGILNWMIEGLKRLNENGKFTKTKLMEQKILEYKQLSDPVGAFLTDPRECMYGSILWIIREDLYNAYKEYAESLGAPIESPRVFYGRVRELPKVAERQKRVKRKVKMIFRGISLAPKEGEPDAHGRGSPDNGPPEDKETTLETFEEEEKIKNEVDEVLEVPIHRNEGKNKKVVIKRGVTNTSSTSSTSNLEDKEKLFVNAIKILREAGGRMQQRNLFQALIKCGHHLMQSNQALRGDKRFIFMGMEVRLANPEEQRSGP